LLQTKAAIAVGRNHSDLTGIMMTAAFDTLDATTATAAATTADPPTTAANPAAAVVVNTTTTTFTVAINKGSCRCGEKH